MCPWLKESANGINETEGRDHPKALVEIKLYDLSKIYLY